MIGDSFSHRDDSFDRGAAAVEMAMVTMLLALLTFGIADVGRAIFTNIGVQDAAQEGARFAAYNPPDGTAASILAIEQRTTESTTYPNLSNDDVQVECVSGDSVKVTVTNTVDYITPVIAQLLGDSIDLSHSYVSDVLVEQNATCP